MDDLQILNYALTLEYLEADFYRRGVDARLFSGREHDVIRAIRDLEEHHVETLSNTILKLGGTPASKPMFKYPAGTFTSKTAFLTMAATFEELGVAAYHGQVTLIQNSDILAAAAAIAGTESRHAAILAELNGGNPFAAPVKADQSMDDVLAAGKPFFAS